MKYLSSLDEAFIYLNDGKSTVIITEMIFKFVVNADKLREAISETMNFYPRLKSRACVDTSGSMQLEYNDDEPPVFEEDGTTRYLGSEDTNGYLFLFTYKERYLKLTFFHALGDLAVNNSFLNHAVIIYLRKIGQDIDDEHLLPSKLDAGVYDEVEECAEDYAKKNNITSTEKNNYEEPHYIEDSEQPYFKTSKFMVRRLTLPYSDLLAVSTKENVSPTTILLDIISQSFIECKDTKGLPIRASLAVNLRKMFESKSQHNFIAIVSVVYPNDVATMDAKDRYSYIASQMNTWMEEEMIVKEVLDLASTTRILKQYFNLNEYEKIEMALEAKQKNSLDSFYLSSMGRAPFAKDVIKNLDDFWQYACIVKPLTDFYAIVIGDKYHLIMADNYVDQSLLDRISEKFKDIGVQATTDSPREIATDLVDPARFKKI